MIKSIIKKGFTLVELIVTITILSILGIVGTISFQSYTTYSRDVVRITDLSNIKSVLEYTYTESGIYPLPDEEKEITYSGGLVWTQGEFGKKSKRVTKRLNKLPGDPLTQNYYTYSVLNTGSEFELGTVMEGNEVLKNNSLLKESYADSLGFKAYVVGNYNGKITKVNTGGVDYILALPSIIASDLSDINLESIVQRNKLVFNGYKNIPSTYGVEYSPLTVEDNSKIEFVKLSNLEVYSGTGIADKLGDPEELRILTQNLQTAYSGTILENESGYNNIINIDLDNSSQLNNQIGILVNNKLGTNIELSSNYVSNSNDCSALTMSGYTIPNISNSNTGSIIKSENLSSGHGTINYSAIATCNDGVLSISNENNSTNCTDGYYGIDCDIAPLYSSCKEILDNSAGNTDGIYKIDPENNGIGFDVYCDMTTDGGGWTQVVRLIDLVDFDGNIDFNSFTNSFSRHYSFSRSILEDMIDNDSSIEGYYKIFDDVNGTNLVQEGASILHNVRGNYASLASSDTIFSNGSKDESSFILNFNGDSGIDFYEPKVTCTNNHSKWSQYWFQNDWGNYNDNGMVYFSTYDGCTWGNYSQSQTVLNQYQSKGYVSLGKVIDVYVRF